MLSLEQIFSDYYYSLGNRSFLTTNNSKKGYLEISVGSRITSYRKNDKKKGEQTKR